MTALLALAAVAAFGGEAAAPKAPRVDSVELVAKGLFEAKDKAVVADAGAVMGAVESVTEKFIAETDTVPGKPGMQFGCRLRLLGKPKGAPVEVRAVTIFPPGGILDPRSGQRVPREEIAQVYKIGDVVYHGYEFTFPWEVVPGRWTFEIWRGKKRLSRQSFLVEKTE